MYIGDKYHQVRPSQIRNAAIDCSLYPDASDARILRDAGWTQLEPLHPKRKRAIHAPALEHPTIVIPGRGSQSRVKTMHELRLQRGGETEVTITSTLTPPPLVMANKPRAPVDVLSPTKRTAVIECFNNNGLHKRNGYWCGASEGKHISGVTVADLARDGMFSVVKNLRHSSARLTERGQWFARTLIEAATEV